MQKYFLNAAKISLILVYLVIIAGAVVRMTGSGMGCPDWPKCFGYYIPPTEIETLQWQPNRDYEKGQVIIVKESLFMAESTFTTGESFENTNWKPYTKHDYATFNVWHTWIEYINRLLGALAGLATLILALLSFGFWRKNKTFVLFSWLIVFGMGFQAWLGATVVYSVLEPVKITLHMLMALAIVALLIYLIKISGEKGLNIKIPATIKTFTILALALTLIQIVLGTQVRQFVDHQIDLVGESAKSLWLADPTIQFYVHRSLSILVLVLNGYLFWHIQKQHLGLKEINWVVLFVVLEIFTGIAMYYIDFPFGSQPLHLVLASLLFGAQFYLLLKVFDRRNSHKTL